MRFLIRDFHTGRWLHRDVPLSDPSVSWSLGDACELSGKITPAMAAMKDENDDFLIWPWKTEIFVEEAGDITWRGFVDGGGASSNSLDVQASGVLAYPNGIPFMDDVKKRKVDPADMYRMLWRHLQSFPGSDLDVKVDDTTTDVLLATETGEADFMASDDEGKKKRVQFSTQEWYEIHQYDGKDIGQEMSQLSTETPFDTREEHSWRGSSREDVDSFIRISYPRTGRRLDDRFVEGENLTNVSTIDLDGSDYATDILFLGKGQGSKRVWATASNPNPKTARRVKTVTDETVGTKKRAKKMAEAALRYYSKTMEISSATIKGVPAIQPGDDILIQARSSVLGDVRQWSRVVTITRGYEHQTDVSVTRSEAWRYA